MYQHLTSEQRYGIFSLLATNSSFSFIAKTLSVSVSTISREIKRNSWRKKYRPKEAQELADGRKKRLVNNNRIKKEVKKTHPLLSNRRTMVAKANLRLLEERRHQRIA